MSFGRSGSPSRLRGAVLSSVGGTAVDQVLSTLSNLIISVSVSRFAGARELGAFTLVFTTATLLTGFQRSLVADPLLTLATAASPSPEQGGAAKRPGGDQTERASITSAVVFALAVAVATAIVGLAAQNKLALVLAAMVPGLLLQDFLRYVAFRRLKPWRAAGLDLIWVLGVCCGIPFLQASRTALTALIIWGLGAWLAVIVNMARRQAQLSTVTEAWQWWKRDARKMGGLLALDSAVYVAASQGLTFGLAIFLGLAGVGEFRAAQIVLGPSGIALTALQLYVLPRLSIGEQPSQRQAIRLSGLAMTVSAVLVGMAIIAGHLIGVRLLGDPLRQGLRLLIPLGVAAIVSAGAIGPLLALKARRNIGIYSITHLGAAVIGVTATLTAAHYKGIYAAAWMLAVQALIDLVGASYALHHASSRSRGAVRPTPAATPALATSAVPRASQPAAVAKPEPAVPVGSGPVHAAAPPGRLSHLDSLRALAALFVVLHHAYLTVFPQENSSAIFAPLGLGQFAVTVFIVLSGYSLTLSYRRRGGLATWPFIRARFRRIILPYWGALAISLALALTLLSHRTGTHWDVAIPVTTEGVLTHLFVVQDFSHTGVQINHALWSVAVEWHIYFLFPLLLVLYRRRGVAVTTTVVAVVTVIVAALGHNVGIDAVGRFDYVGCFALGSAACLLGETLDRRRVRLVGWAAAIGFVITSKGPAAHLPVAGRDLLIGLAMAAALVLLPGSTTARKLSHPWLVHIGTFSFSLYLIHAPVLQLVWEYLLAPAGFHLGTTSGLLSLLVLGTLASLSAAWLFFVVCERPSMTRRMRAGMFAELSQPVPVNTT